MPRALLSVSDKTGLAAFARDLHEQGWTLLSTGGTARSLRESGLPVREVSEVTGHPEIMDGRVKTLHPAIHAGLLGRRGNVRDEQAMYQLGYGAIDLVAVNLYPFRETIARSGVSLEEAVENIDIGGPSMLRSAAKNHQSVWVVVDPADYGRVLERLGEPWEQTLGMRRALAAKVYSHTSSYDAAIADYLDQQTRDGASPSSTPERITVKLTRMQSLRYGENPDQNAAFYAEEGLVGGLPSLRQLHGKELSFNNLLDVDGALLTISAWAESRLAACAIIKHSTPCGVAVAEDAAEAYTKAVATDPTSAFGSVIAFNTPLTLAVAELIRPNFVEAVVAPQYDPEALELLRSKKNLRLLQLPVSPADGLDFKRVAGGFLVQDRPRISVSEDDWQVVTGRTPSEEEWGDLRFAWRSVAAVKSNAILLARGGATVGIGAGQMSRVDASRIAVLKAADAGFDLQGAVLASDAFFPFRDGVDAAAEAGIKAVIQPGGSVRDAEVIAAADEHGVAMVFTGRRLFRH
ncbi:bifunctional phosphoribosylaminoimidazolecarboxamide formyltransferase/IMP cyclohydrolase [soil metagenome]